MSFCIVRVSETPEGMTRTRLPGDYGDGQQVAQALDKVLSAYESYGQNDEQGYPRARDDKGQIFRFEIAGD
jgi:hypothetical protein